MRQAGNLFDSHGTALYNMASVLTNDPLHAEALVVDAISSQLAIQQPSVRELAAAAYVAWSCRPEPATLVLTPVDGRLPSATLPALHLLPDDQRAAYALCAFGDHTHTQTANVLGLPAPKVARLLREVFLTLAPPFGAAVAL